MFGNVSKLLASSAILASSSSTGLAQALFTFDDQVYESVNWPTTNGFHYASTGPLVGTWEGGGGGELTFSGATHINVIAQDSKDFLGEPHLSAGYGIQGVDQVRINGGQLFYGTGNPNNGGSMSQVYNLSGDVLPTEMLMYVGNRLTSGGDGMKYVEWNFGSGTSGTTFSMVSNTPSITTYHDPVTGLSKFTNTGTDNNLAAVLLRIQNPDGIKNFTITTNRLDGSGASYIADNANQAADMTDMAFLVAIPEPSAVTIAGASGFLFLMRRRRK